ncbi:hypothetical protein ACFLVK_00610 [Chloroflexota bacterium]
MFWERRTRQQEYTTPPLGLFILLFLAGSLQTVEHYPKKERKSLHTAILKGIAAEIFIVGGAIADERPDLVPEIFKQMIAAEQEQAMEQARSMLGEVLNIPDLKLESLPDRITGYATKILQDRLPGYRLDDWDQTLFNIVMITGFSPGCILGCEHTQLFRDMLQRRLRKLIDEEPLPLALQMNIFYSNLLSKEGKSTLEALAKVDVETPPLQKFVMLYQEIATTILANYEREFGSLPV